VAEERRERAEHGEAPLFGQFGDRLAARHDRPDNRVAFAGAGELAWPLACRVAMAQLHRDALSLVALAL